jgi:Protein of unknown function (DUF1071).
MENTFNRLNKINVNEYTEKKGNLTYLSWSNAWEAVKRECPSASYEIKKNEANMPYFFERGVGYMVMTTVTIESEILEMWLPVMDYKNKAMLEPTMTDINKALMRCLAKNLAMFGLGLYIYKGEDLPSEEDKAEQQEREAEKQSITAVMVVALRGRFEEEGINEKKILALYKLSNLEEMTLKQHNNLHINFEQAKEKCKIKSEE